MAHWPYNTAAWRRLRLAKLAEQPTCEPCSARGVVQVANTVDHKRSIASGGDAFPPLAGLSSMCPSCHARKTAAFDRPGGKGGSVLGVGLDGLPIDPEHPFNAPADRVQPARADRMSEAARARALPLGMRPSRIPLVIVCGPPGAGKSSYVAAHAATEDLVIDFDVIKARLAGSAVHASVRGWTIPALIERNRLLAGLSSNRRHARAWFIIGGARAEDRQHWQTMLGPERTVLVYAEQEECIRRIRQDPARVGRAAEMAQWVKAWFAAAGDTPFKDCDLFVADRRPTFSNS